MSAPDVNALLSFALYGAANRLIRMHKPLLAPMGLTFPQYLVMLELMREAPRSVGDLGTKLGMDTGTITPLLKRLTDAEMVNRRRDPEDERRVMIALSHKGEALRTEILAVPHRLQTSCDITPERADELREALDGVGR